MGQWMGQEALYGRWTFFFCHEL